MTTGSGASTAHVMTDFLRAADVPFVFGYPGTSNIEFMEGARQRGVETILARREGTAVFMAEAFGMLTGRPGVCLSTLGPGSTALVNGVAAAHLDRVPMLAISGQIGSQREPYFTHQVVDHKLLFSPVTKWAGRVEAGAVATIMRKALRLATAERPGPVHLTTNSDVAAAEATDAEVSLPPFASAASAATIHVAEGAKDPLRTLGDARRPVLLVGTTAVRQGADEAVRRFAEAQQIPVVVSPMAKGVFPEDHPLFAGVLDMACNDVVWGFLDSADLILAAGFDPVELIKPWRVEAPVIHIDAVENADQIYRSDVELIGSIASLLDWLGSAGGESAWTDDDVEQHRGRLRDAYYAGRVEGKLNPTDVVDAVRHNVRDDAIVTTDVGSHKLLVGQGWTSTTRRSCLMTNGLSSMGFSLPAAIGAKLTCPDRQVVCTTGDGGFAMVQGELRLAAALGLGIIVVVLADNSLNRIELKQLKLGYPSTATRIETTDLVQLAGSMACDGVLVEDVASLEAAVSGAKDLDRPLVIDARVDPSQYLSQF
jgi:acetolactate synthase I/II/III large subunit